VCWCVHQTHTRGEGGDVEGWGEEASVGVTGCFGVVYSTPFESAVERDTSAGGGINVGFVVHSGVGSRERLRYSSRGGISGQEFRSSLPY
jgi:hypothetical protein